MKPQVAKVILMVTLLHMLHVTQSCLQRAWGI
jgi:hypothetical protein